ncbi:MAG: FHA domain-containing protein [Aristaeellaceae bacterium]
MKKLRGALALALVAVMLCASVALAADELFFCGGRVFPDGYMHLIFSTSYTNAEDMNFEAVTEKGSISVENAFVLRDGGTSWFILLDYGRDGANSAYVTKTQDSILRELKGLVSDIDEGALITVCDTPEINVTNAATLRDNLQQTPGTSSQSALVSTLSKTLSFINQNRAVLMPKISIVLITTASEIDTGVPAEVEKLLSEGNNAEYTTHIICTAGSEKNFGAAEGGWRDKANKLSSKALKTFGGTGYVTDTLTDDEAAKAVRRVKDAECSLVRVELDPLKNRVIDKTITVAQVTSGGKRMETAVKLSDDNLKTIEDAIASQVPPVEHSYVANAASTFISVEPVSTTQEGISVELIVAIVLGVVILALIVVLVLVRVRGAGKKKQQQVYANTAQTVRTSRTVVRLASQTGGTLNGELTGGRLTIGRDPSRARLVIGNDKKVSGLHATLTLQGNVMTLTDNNSTNGVAVNGTRVQGSCTVQQNDAVTIGANTYTITWRRS